MKREQGTSCNHAVVTFLQSLSKPAGLTHQPQTVTAPAVMTQSSTTTVYSHIQLQTQVPGLPSPNYPLTTIQANVSNSRKKPTPPPVPGVYIPDLDHGNLAWKSAIKQWNEGDTKKSLQPLKEWPREWYTGSMHLITGAKYSQRRLIAEEFSK